MNITMDLIIGNVTNVVDGDTFDLAITHIGTQNQYTYSNLERIRISGIDAPELNTLQGKRDKTTLERTILNKNVQIFVETRDTFHRIVGSVKLI